MSTVLIQKQTTTQRLSPQQILVTKLLQLPIDELETRIKEEIENNVVLEEAPKSSSDDINQISLDKIKQEENENHVPNYIKIQNSESSSSNYQIPNSNTLLESLLEQLSFQDLDSKDLAIAEFIICSADDDGYLTNDLYTLSDDILYKLGIDVPTSHLEELISRIQRLDPPGICSRDVQEALTIQMELQKNSEDRTNALTILKNYFEDFSRKRYDYIRENSGLTQEELRRAETLILHLSPKPAAAFSDTSYDDNHFIIPDFKVENHDGELSLTMNTGNLPRIRLSKQYMEMLEDLSGNKRPLSSSEKETYKFIKGKADAGQSFIGAIKQRQETLLHTMQAILEYQHDFFTDGDKTKLRPMVLKNIAEKTNLDISTISRVVNSKYVETSFGIVFLKELFSEGMQTSSGEEISVFEIQEALKECISTEDKTNPLTDEQLTEILKKKGFVVARRTVAEYRNELNIPVARLRKRA